MVAYAYIYISLTLICLGVLLGKRGADASGPIIGSLLVLPFIGRTLGWW